MGDRDFKSRMLTDGTSAYIAGAVVSLTGHIHSQYENVISAGTAAVPTLIGGAGAVVPVTIKPVFVDTNYQAVAIVTGGVSLLAALSVTATAPVSGSLVNVTVQNTGLLSLGGGAVLVFVIHN